VNGRDVDRGGDPADDPDNRARLDLVIVSTSDQRIKLPAWFATSG
jgi:hypothetical protein